jgi:hypothetical protein
MKWLRDHLDPRVLAAKLVWKLWTLFGGERK